jgi:hypothetical protein
MIVQLLVVAGPLLIAVVALCLNYRGFSSINSRFAEMDNRVSSLEATVNSRFSGIDNRLNAMQGDMKDLNKAMTALEIDVALLKRQSRVIAAN